MSQVRVPQGEPNSKKAVSKDAAFLRFNATKLVPSFMSQSSRRPRPSPAGGAKFQKSRVERRGFLRFNATKLVPSFMSQSSPPASESLRGSQIPEKPCRKTRRFTFQCDETRTEFYVAELRRTASESLRGSQIPKRSCRKKCLLRFRNLKLPFPDFRLNTYTFRTNRQNLMFHWLLFATQSRIITGSELFTLIIMTEYFLLLVGTVLVNNFVLVKFLGLLPFHGRF